MWYAATTTRSASRVSHEASGRGTISVPITLCQPESTSRAPSAAATHRAASGTTIRSAVRVDGLVAGGSGPDEVAAARLGDEEKGELPVVTGAAVDAGARGLVAGERHGRGLASVGGALEGDQGHPRVGGGRVAGRELGLRLGRLHGRVVRALVLRVVVGVDPLEVPAQRRLHGRLGPGRGDPGAQADQARHRRRGGRGRGGGGAGGAGRAARARGRRRGRGGRGPGG